MDTITAQDGSIVHDGDEVTLVLQHGVYEDIGGGVTNGGPSGFPIEREVRGTVHRREQIERVYDAEAIAVGTRTEVHWEVLTGDPVHPAVGFLPEHVLRVAEE